MKQPNIIWLGAWLFLAIGTFATATKLHTANQRLDSLLEELRQVGLAEKADFINKYQAADAIDDCWFLRNERT